MTVEQHGLVVHPNQGTVVTVAGDIVIFKAVGEQTNGQYALFEIWAEPQKGPPSHIHGREDEAFYVQEGEVEFYLDDQTVVATPGTFLHSPRGQRHSYKVISSQPAKMLCWVTPAGLEQFFAEVGTVLSNPNISPPLLTPEAIEKMKTIAPKYGITILPPVK
ncbi:quercetin 2,3-dioxygenase [Chroococcus sp. FPU101]|uniref:quercetin 2,3-dioxygenase n=1 Tax=Chroococcus sp. FPU101 TaxID=1974212 RepID=UPI001A8CD597|nr:quercetin 2,3-dioxygenase [Chroococcus sp. FPU101]GFE71640.1 cupin 2 domain-containing protein [Chroococcus sp. FPU101]